GTHRRRSNAITSLPVAFVPSLFAPLSDALQSLHSFFPRSLQYIKPVFVINYFKLSQLLFAVARTNTQMSATNWCACHCALFPVSPFSFLPSFSFFCLRTCRAPQVPFVSPR